MIFALCTGSNGERALMHIAPTRISFLVPRSVIYGLLWALAGVPACEDHTWLPLSLFIIGANLSFSWGKWHSISNWISQKPC